MAQNTFERREKKIILNAELFPEIEKRILDNFIPDKYNTDGRPYEICNIYFDNENRDITRHSVSRPFYKEKLRLRSYGTPTFDSNVFFEIKRKMNKVGTKRRAMLPLFKVYDYLESGILPKCERFIDDQVLKEIDYIIKTYGAKPTIYISYLRKAYFSKDDPSLRLTFDSDILTRHTDLRLEEGRFGEPLLPEGKMLMELKFNGATPLSFAKMMSEYGLTYGRFSKVGKEFEAFAGKQIQNV